MPGNPEGMIFQMSLELGSRLAKMFNTDGARKSTTPTAICQLNPNIALAMSDQSANLKIRPLVFESGFGFGTRI
jgi:hypothetical protein